jgi:hypothetical protein
VGTAIRFEVGGSLLAAPRLRQASRSRLEATNLLCCGSLSYLSRFVKEKESPSAKKLMGFLVWGKIKSISKIMAYVFKF